MTAADSRFQNLPAAPAISPGRALDALENIPGSFVALDSQWRVIYANAEAERLRGLPRREMLGRTQWELFPDTAGAPVERELKRAAADRVTVEFEYCDGRRCLHVKAWPESDGGLSVFSVDISARKSAENALRDTDERFRAIFDTTPECVKVVAPDGTLLEMNPAGL
ncbi:MAG TPA: PAS domain-containing protein, partial [Bryobacteraceae bacterium]